MVILVIITYAFLVSIDVFYKLTLKNKAERAFTNHDIIFLLLFQLKDCLYGICNLMRLLVCWYWHSSIRTYEYMCCTDQCPYFSYIRKNLVGLCLYYHL